MELIGKWKRSNKYPHDQINNQIINFIVKPKNKYKVARRASEI